MFFILFIFALIINCLYAFAIFYFYDTVHLMRDKYNYYNIKIQMPSLKDLKEKFTDNIDEYKKVAQEYTNDVILPAKSFFKLENQILEYQKNSDTHSMFPIFCLPSPWILLAASLFLFEFTDSILLCFIISLPIYCLCIYLVYRYYNRKFSDNTVYSFTLRRYDLPKKYYTTLKDKFNFLPQDSDYKKYPISEKAALNNFVIIKYYNKLYDMKEAVEKRHSGKKVFEILIWVFAVVAMFIACAISEC